MRAVILRGEQDLSLEEVPDPVFGPREVLVRVKAVGLCGSDLHVYQHLDDIRKRVPVNDPVVLGHEYSGQVMAVGADVNGLAVGDRVVVDPNYACGECVTCRMGAPSTLCENLRIYGSAFAEMAVAPSRNVYRIAATTTYAEASYSEPLSCVLRAVDLLAVKNGRRAAVIGCGPAGLLFVQVLSISGASGIIAIARRQVSLLAAKQMGADVIIDNTADDPRAKVDEITGNEGAASVVDTVGSTEATRLAVHIASRGGCICLYALPATDDVSFPAWPIFDKELRIMGANRNPGTFARSLALIENGKIRPTALTSHSISLQDLPAYFSLLNDEGKKAEAGIIKVVVHP